jgi:glucose/arabinose dehydrogenase
LLIPKDNDTLFWCLYIAKNGIHEYEMINQGYSNIEIAEKDKVMAFIKTQPSKLKNTNVKVTNIAIQEIMSDIITNTKLNVSTLIAMSLFYKRRIILTKDNKLYINIGNKNNNK